MNRHVYQLPRTYLRYDAKHIIGYLYEEVLENYVPRPETIGDEDKTVTWPKAYAYTGTEVDGGTVMECADPDNYGDIANAIIRSKYSESQELAIQRHAINGDYAENAQEYEEYNDWCTQAVITAKRWIQG